MIVHISPYVDHENRATRSSALARYTHNLLSAFPPEDRARFVVLAQRGLEQPDFEIEGIRVHSCWGGMPWRYVWDLSRAFRRLRKQEPVTGIHLQFEHFAFGAGALGIANAFAVLFVCAWQRITKGTKVVITTHGVLSPSILTPEFIREQGGGLPPLVLKSVFGLTYKMISWASNYIVVHSAGLKARLETEWRGIRRDVYVIPIMLYGYDAGKDILIPEIRERQTEGKKVILTLGFLARYKGLETLIDEFPAEGDCDYHCIIAGSSPKRLDKDESYQAWRSELKRQVDANRNVSLVEDYIPDEALPSWYIEADIVVIPYQYMLASSGPLVWALATRSNLLVSTAFEGMIDSCLIYQRGALLERSVSCGTAEHQAAVEREAKQRVPEKVVSQLLVVYDKASLLK